MKKSFSKSNFVHFVSLALVTSFIVACAKDKKDSLVRGRVSPQAKAADGSAPTASGTGAGATGSAGSVTPGTGGDAGGTKSDSTASDNSTADVSLGSCQVVEDAKLDEKISKDPKCNILVVAMAEDGMIDFKMTIEKGKVQRPQGLPYHFSTAETKQLESGEFVSTLLASAVDSGSDKDEDKKEEDKDAAAASEKVTQAEIYLSYKLMHKHNDVDPKKITVKIDDKELTSEQFELLPLVDDKSDAAIIHIKMFNTEEPPIKNANFDIEIKYSLKATDDSGYEVTAQQ